MSEDTYRAGIKLSKYLDLSAGSFHLEKQIHEILDLEQQVLAERKE
jgi:hypothetical protein